PVDVGEARMDHAVEPLARGGQLQMPDAAAKEWLADLRLERTDLPGDGGLSQVELFGRQGEAEQARRGLEAAQVGEADGADAAGRRHGHIMHASGACMSCGKFVCSGRGGVTE